MSETGVKQELAKGEMLSVVSLLNHLIDHAFALRASDIHLDPTEKNLIVRFRIDGVLRPGFTFPKDIHSEIVSRIKVIAGLRTDEHQAAQDGRFRYESTIHECPIDIRISIAPTYHGENAVLRLLASHEEEFSLEKLGFSEKDRARISRAIQHTSGMILATGPTGSGKTTTLYTLVQMLHSDDVSIVTIEDPIEYAVDGIRQIQVNPRTGLTFAHGLRSILRQDPNIIMVGEIRDSEAAGIAVNASLTGHLLLTTLHTNDAATTLPRLLDMDIEPYLVASTVNIAIGQRLVRKICEHCKETRQLSGAEAASLSEALPPGTVWEGMEIRIGRGCEQCNNTGYKGRVSVNEVLVMSNAIRDAVLRKASAREIKEIAQSEGMTTILEDGLEKVRNGITTLTEVVRVIHE